MQHNGKCSMLKQASRMLAGRGRWGWWALLALTRVNNHEHVCKGKTEEERGTLLQWKALLSLVFPVQGGCWTQRQWSDFVFFNFNVFLDMLLK